jgi:dolichol-phosphate mannosyltransferase
MIKAHPEQIEGLDVEFVRNRLRGAHSAVMSGFAASRFIPGGCMEGCRWLKATLVRTAAFTLYYFARLPTRDATNGFRLFSRRVIDRIEIESDSGFCYSLEMLVKCHRLGWPVADVPAKWFERKQRASRFQVLNWVPSYLRWYWYAFATTFLRLPPSSVKQHSYRNTAK